MPNHIHSSRSRVHARDNKTRNKKVSKNVSRKNKKRKHVYPKKKV